MTALKFSTIQKRLACFLWVAAFPLKRKSAAQRLFAFLLLVQTTALASPSTSRYDIGTASSDLVVPANIIMGGFGVFIPPFTSEPRKAISKPHDPLQVNAFAFRGIRGQISVIVGIDAVGLQKSLVTKITNRVQITNSNVMPIISATHAHSTPDTFGLWGRLPKDSGVDPNYIKHLEDVTVNTILKAVSSLKPAKVSFSVANLDTLTKGVLAPNPITILWAKDPVTNQVIGTLTSWNAHPTVLPQANTSVSSDFVGAYRIFMKQEFGRYSNHTYVNGFLAGVYPQILGSQKDVFNNESVQPEMTPYFEAMSWLGKTLFERVVESRATEVEIFDTSSFIRQASVFVGITNPLFRLAAKLKIVEGDLNSSGNVASHLQWFKLGPIQGVGLPGEPSQEVAQDFFELMKSRGIEHTIMIGQSGDMLGYILDPESQWGKNPWEYQTLISSSQFAAEELLNRFKSIFWW